jgi:hypothetical protein
MLEVKLLLYSNCSCIPTALIFILHLTPAALYQCIEQGIDKSKTTPMPTRFPALLSFEQEPKIRSRPLLSCYHQSQKIDNFSVASCRGRDAISSGLRHNPPNRYQGDPWKLMTS